MAGCTHDRTLSLSAKCSDMCYVNWPDGTSSDGYAPNIDGLGGGDNVDVVVCIDCKVVIGLADADAILAVHEEVKAAEVERIARFEARQAARRG